MEFTDAVVEALESADDTPRVPDGSLLAEALIKAEKLVDHLAWLNHTLPASQAIVRDFNVLRAFVIEGSPRLAPVLPPELPISEGPTPGVNSGGVSYGEIKLFCEQIKEFLENRKEEERNRPLIIDDGATLFGPDGFKHDPALLAAARAKAQSIYDFVKSQEGFYGAQCVPAAVLADYHQLLALIREAAPDSASILPREIAIPADPKPVPEDQLAASNRSWFSSFFRRDGRPKTLKYREFLYHCQQIARLIK